MLQVLGFGLYGIFFTIWHIGIEQKLFSGPEGCAASINNATSTEDLKKQILNKEIVSCDEVIWTIFGLSAATINLILLNLKPKIFQVETSFDNLLGRCGLYVARTTPRFSDLFFPDDTLYY